MNKKITFALYFGNRGFFPAKYIKDARKEMAEAVTKSGNNYIIAPEELTKYGAVETHAEGKLYAEFLNKHQGEYDGIIICLPNFGDENGVIEALKNCKVPILIQAYDDEPDKMSPDSRRDAFCGKFAIMDVLYQLKIPFTVYQPQTVNPNTNEFIEQLNKFSTVCRIVKGMKSFKVGAIGARTTAFKTVRFDELAWAKYGVDTETFDLSWVFAKIKALDNSHEKVMEKLAVYKKMSDFSEVSEEKSINIAKIGVVIDEIIEDYGLSAIALRCWSEFQQEFGVSPCVSVCELNSRGIAAACELDVNNAIAMRALNIASNLPSVVLDWNNNYGKDLQKCIVFHCGPAANELLKDNKSKVGRHYILENTYGENNCTGVNVGKFDTFDFTYASAKTHDGAIHFYLGEGEFTDDPVDSRFFGTYGVVKMENLQDVLQYLGENGYKHHVSLTKGNYKEELTEAFEKYLDYKVKAF